MESACTLSRRACTFAEKPSDCATEFLCTIDVSGKLEAWGEQTPNVAVVTSRACSAEEDEVHTGTAVEVETTVDPAETGLLIVTCSVGIDELSKLSEQVMPLAEMRTELRPANRTGEHPRRLHFRPGTEKHTSAAEP